MLKGLIKSAIVARFLGKNRVGFLKTQQEKELKSFFIIKKYQYLMIKMLLDRTAIYFQKHNFEISKTDILNKKPFIFKMKMKVYQYLDEPENIL